MWKAKCNVFLSVSRYKERLSVRVITYIEQLQKVKKKKYTWIYFDSLDSQEKVQIWNRQILPWIWLIVVSINDLY